METWLVGYYPNDMDEAGGWELWQQQWTMIQEEADKKRMVWFEGYYTKATARIILKTNREG